MKTNCIGIIPARYASTRFPGKPLALVMGKPMIERVYAQAQKATYLSEVFVATDDQRIQSVVQAFGGRVVMTSPDCASGTDRCAEVLAQIPVTPDLVVNIQGDEPLLQPSQIDQLVNMMQTSGADIGTLGSRISDLEAIFNPNVVKLVKAKSGKALYFSRNPIPFVRGEDKENWITKAPFFRHLGMYAYTANALTKVAGLPTGTLEAAESLEQLRWLEAGFSIYVAETQFESIGIDTPEDLKWIEANWEKLEQ